MKLSSVFALTLFISLAGSVARSCLGPLPAMCTVEFVNNARSQAKSHEKSMRAVARKIRKDGELHIEEVRAAMLPPGAKLNIELIQNQAQREEAMRENPLGYAQRLEALRSKLSPSDWKVGVKMWSEYISRSADISAQTDYSKFCGFSDEAKSLALDASLIVFLPYATAYRTQVDQAVVMAPLAVTAGVVSLGLDIVTFIPGAAINAERKLRENFHVQRSTKSFQRLVVFVRTHESKPG